MIRSLLFSARSRKADADAQALEFDPLPDVTSVARDYSPKRGEVLHAQFPKARLGRLQDRVRSRASAVLEDEGTLYATSQGLVWQGNLKTRRWRWSQVQSCSITYNGFLLRPVSGRNVAIVPRKYGRPEMVEMLRLTKRFL